MKKLAVSFILSLLLAWLLGAIMLTSPSVCRMDKKLGIPLPLCGTIKQERGENWVCSCYGGLGLEAGEARRAENKVSKCLILGDSYIEANMVEPRDRVQNVLSHMGVQAFGIGVSGNSCVEDSQLMAVYNRALSNVRTNVVVIADISDILPPSGTTDFTLLKPCYPFRKIEGKLGEFSYRLRLQTMRVTLKSLKKLLHDGLDLQGNHWRNKVENNGEVAVEDTSHYEAYWRSMLAAMKANAPEGRLMIVYAPIVPRIYRNAIHTENPDQQLIDRFAVVCGEFDLLGGGLVNAGAALCDYTRQTGSFARGFFNTRPGEGHMNASGHRILAECIYRTLFP